MLNIVHRQMTAYPPESNGAVERLHRRLKDVPPRQLGPMSYFMCSSDFELSRGKTLVFPQLNLFLELQLSYLMRSYSLMNLLLILLLKIFNKTLDTPVSAFSLPRHNCSSSLPSELPAELLSARLVWVRCDGPVLLLQLLYDGPYAVIRRGGRSFTLQVGSREEIFAGSRLKACTTADAVPGNPRRRGRPLGKRPSGSAAAKRVSFAHPFASTPLITAPPRNGPRTVFLPRAEVFACPGPAPPSTSPQQRNPPRQQTPPRNTPRYPQRQRTPPQRMDL
jgi:hypothetical protein